uniref:Uncharacterized protein n=1 Tax=Arundo donax TaxID=35708 RepID=A0A0A9ES01_ARUDO
MFFSSAIILFSLFVTFSHKYNKKLHCRRHARCVFLNKLKLEFRETVPNE